MSTGKAFAKINLALVVGDRRDDGKHEVVTVLQRIDLHDTIALEAADALVVEGFSEDTIVREALESLAAAVGCRPRWRVRIEKRIPVAAGLGGGSSDAATALELANAELDEPRTPNELRSLAARLGADVPFFLRPGPQLGRGDGTELERIDLPTGYAVLLVVPHDEAKESTGEVYAAFDRRGGAAGFSVRAAALARALASVTNARDLAVLPANDLASSPFARELEAAGAFRADVSGAGPAVYGLFEDPAAARRAADRLAHAGRTFVTAPVEAADRS
jgi:4-diphosphocytidyl-2-C-methyl-D-erythritol kinase